MTNQITTHTQLSTFNFENSAIRVVSINNEPWFVVADLCRALGLSSPTKAILNLDEDEVALNSIQGISKGNDQVNIVSESGMYTLILRCRDAVKKGSVPHRFRKWVTAEVLPQIRKTGQYSQNNQRNLPLAVEQDEEALNIIVNLFHSLNSAYDMGEKLRTQAPHLARQIDNEIGGHYIYNLHMPTKQALEKARKFVHAKSERIMFVKGMLSLLEEPKRLVHTNF
ncbi:hypothetical protein A1D29_05990 [Pasteurellaceae bacterium Orientalotternb1]|nr:hypothetical protein A1D29_05990 [Pasteurellaceae bacterium Orientalotternb1]